MIDQLATIAAPAIAGLLLTRAGLTITSVIFMCLVVFTWAGQAFCMRVISQRVPDINKMPLPSKFPLSDELTLFLLGHLSDDSTPQSCEGVLATYVRQRAFPAAFALAILYMTVLTFGGVCIVSGLSLRRRRMHREPFRSQ